MMANLIKRLENEPDALSKIYFISISSGLIGLGGFLKVLEMQSLELKATLMLVNFIFFSAAYFFYRIANVLTGPESSRVLYNSFGVLLLSVGLFFFIIFN